MLVFPDSILHWASICIDTLSRLFGSCEMNDNDCDIFVLMDNFRVGEVTSCLWGVWVDQSFWGHLLSNNIWFFHVQPNSVTPEKSLSVLLSSNHHHHNHHHHHHHYRHHYHHRLSTVIISLILERENCNFVSSVKMSFYMTCYQWITWLVINE